MRKAVVQFLSATIFLAVFQTATANASDYPEPRRVIKLIVPYPAGGPGDLLARSLVDSMSKDLKGTFIIENVPGGTQVIAARRVAESVPDGYTLLMGSVANMAINPVLKKSLPYDPVKDFAPISLVSITPQVLIARRDFPANNLLEMIALARKQPDEFTNANLGPGSSAHLASELLHALSGAKLRQVPYTGAANVVRDMLGGFVDMTYTTGVITLLETGQIKAFGVTTSERSPALPNVPSIAELGFPEFDQSLWLGILAPRGTPENAVQILSTSIHKTVMQPQFRDRLGAFGAESRLIGSTPGEFEQFIDKEIAKWRMQIKKSGVEVP